MSPGPVYMYGCVLSIDFIPIAYTLRSNQSQSCNWSTDRKQKHPDYYPIAHNGEGAWDISGSQVLKLPNPSSLLSKGLSNHYFLTVFLSTACSRPSLNSTSLTCCSEIDQSHIIPQCKGPMDFNMVLGMWYHAYTVIYSNIL